ncbi:hypothetical protein [Tenacibaculum aiptasiae]|uniref:hypothetical protein n=1 Tax=Tenacibaculum aiptasiae TaxID=426481 RepID=UPI00232BE402|nr:hypothetical protein [Tenacibaculum aiptasiae]
MKTKDLEYNNFTTKSFLSVAMPSYLFPAIMSWISGWILENPELMKASYKSIALPSLIATIFVYLILKELQKNQKILKERYTKTFFIIITIASLSLLIINLFKLESYKFDILLSSTIGTVITIWKFSLKKHS